jgi:hypothetical protein
METRGRRARRAYAQGSDALFGRAYAQRWSDFQGHRPSVALRAYPRAYVPALFSGPRAYAPDSFINTGHMPGHMRPSRASRFLDAGGPSAPWCRRHGPRHKKKCMSRGICPGICPAAVYEPSLLVPGHMPCPLANLLDRPLPGHQGSMCCQTLSRKKMRWSEGLGIILELFCRKNALE